MKHVTLVLVALALILGGVGQAGAGTVLITSRTGTGGLNGTDYVDWGFNISNLTDRGSPFFATSAGGVTINVSEAGGPFEGRQQGSSWGSNFANGDNLLWTRAGGPITISTRFFGSHPVSAAGTQISSDFGSFTAEITAFDSFGHILGQYTENGNPVGPPGSAIFIGIQSSSADISSIQLSLTSDSTGLTSGFDSTADFAINRFDFTAGSPAATPEPASLTLLGIGAVCSLGYAWRRRKRAVA
jgi:hypothetical protein